MKIILTTTGFKILSDAFKNKTKITIDKILLGSVAGATTATDLTLKNTILTTTNFAGAIIGDNLKIIVTDTTTKNYSVGELGLVDLNNNLICIYSAENKNFLDIKKKNNALAFLLDFYFDRENIQKLFIFNKKLNINNYATVKQAGIFRYATNENIKEIATNRAIKTGFVDLPEIKKQYFFSGFIKAEKLFNIIDQIPNKDLASFKKDEYFKSEGTAKNTYGLLRSGWQKKINDPSQPTPKIGIDLVVFNLLKAFLWFDVLDQFYFYKIKTVVADLNNYKTTGRFSIKAVTYLNAPLQDTNGFLGYTVADDDGANFYQIIQDYDTKICYTRKFTNKNSGTWVNSDPASFEFENNPKSLQSVKIARRIYTTNFFNNKLMVGIHWTSNDNAPIDYFAGFLLLEVETNNIYYREYDKVNREQYYINVTGFLTIPEFNKILSITKRAFNVYKTSVKKLLEDQPVNTFYATRDEAGYGGSAGTTGKAGSGTSLWIILEIIKGKKKVVQMPTNIVHPLGWLYVFVYATYKNALAGNWEVVRKELGGKSRTNEKKYKEDLIKDAVLAYSRAVRFKIAPKYNNLMEQLFKNFLNLQGKPIPVITNASTNLNTFGLARGFKKSSIFTDSKTGIFFSFGGKIYFLNFIKAIIEQIEFSSAGKAIITTIPQIKI